jgi:hypothetical protein
VSAEPSDTATMGLPEAVESGGDTDDSDEAEDGEQERREAVVTGHDAVSWLRASMPAGDAVAWSVPNHPQRHVAR